MLDPQLVELADHFGIATDFWDWKGQHVDIAEDTIVQVLASLGVDATTSDSRAAAAEDVRLERWRRVIAPCIVVTQGSAAVVDVHLPAGENVEVEVRCESGQRVAARQVDNWEPDAVVDGVSRGEASFAFDDLPLGYHTVTVTGSEGTHTSRLVVTPPSVGYPRAMEGKRAWGFASQLYSVTSRKSWGVGDLQDLADLMTWAGATCDADYLLINPLHAAEPMAPLEPSPYLPASRRFLNPLYIRPESIPEYRDVDRHTRQELKRLRKTVKASESARVDRDGSWNAKRQALRVVFEQPLRPVRQAAFDAYRRRHGQALNRFATWSVLCTHYGQDWREWPELLRDPASAEVAAFAANHDAEIRFFAWLQWIAEEQLSAAQGAARDGDMTIGVITDLAVGVSGASAETWMMPDMFAAGVTVGAPPDQYNQFGQDWGQPPWRPDRLEAEGYEPFRAMVAAAIRRVGGVRIDHIMGLFRLWWVPQGGGPQDGTYVRYNHEAMVGILALEAYRAQALVVGEDLGTVEPWVRDYLAQRGILGTSVAWFEYGPDGKPLDPIHWRADCMASVTTHDIPPTLGYLRGDHVRLRDELGLLTEPLETELSHAHAEQEAFRQILVDKGCLDAGNTDAVDMMVALHQYIASGPARILVAALADAVGERRTQNQPGTIDEYPNWRVPLGDELGDPVHVEDLVDLELPRRIAAVFNADPR